MTTQAVKFADYLAEVLADLKYTHCFFVAGGNVMHLVEAFSHKVTMVPVVHEVSAVIGAEYFTALGNGRKALALVTAGPGITNAITGVSGAWLESRECLVIGGQVKSSDRASEGLRQRGIQEIDGLGLVRSICIRAKYVDCPLDRREVIDAVMLESGSRRGPVFLEIPLDVQAKLVAPNETVSTEDAVPHEPSSLPSSQSLASPAEFDQQLVTAFELLARARRPALLLGGGVDYDVARSIETELDRLGIPIFTSWNGADRYASDRPMWFGRPDTWGMRDANVLLQSSDLVFAVGCRLSLQQTGFNWDGFVPNGKVVHVDIDRTELSKDHPCKELRVEMDSQLFLRRLLRQGPFDFDSWVQACRDVGTIIGPGHEVNSEHEGYLQPQAFVAALSRLCSSDDVVIPCSSGGAFTVMMQGFRNRSGQRMLTNKALASMGYGLAGSIGASLAERDSRTVLVEGDGGFAQNLQDLGTVAAQQPNLKMFLFVNGGYASIRMTQLNYFSGNIVGCDFGSGLGLPDWGLIAAAYGIECMTLEDGFEVSDRFLQLWQGRRPCVFIVPVHPEQTYFPKIGSRVLPNGGMESSPLEVMLPSLDEEVQQTIDKILEIL
jgi:acetolactate synthase-1/2/3 large subunit